jgi:predicted RNA-binding Zn ribbon-like protein
MTIVRHPPLGTLRDDACLAFANTLSWRGREAPLEELGDLDDLLQWAAGSVGLAAEVVGELESWAHQRPAMAAELLAEAIALREVIYRIFSALASGDTVSDQDLAALNRALAAAPSRDRLAPTDAGYGWQIGPAALSAATLLAPVLWSASDLMVSDRRQRVRLCSNAQCLWLFLDQSKGGTKRWCAMAACGNRAKARRHYRRTRGPGG